MKTANPDLPTAVLTIPGWTVKNRKPKRNPLLPKLWSPLRVSEPLKFSFGPVLVRLDAIRLRWRSVLSDDTCRCWKVDKKDLKSLERSLKLVGATDISIEVGKHIMVKFAKDGEKALVTLS